MHHIASTFQVTCILKIDSEKEKFCKFIKDLMFLIINSCFLTPSYKVFQTILLCYSHNCWWFLFTHVLLLILNENNVKWNHKLHQICF